MMVKFLKILAQHKIIKEYLEGDKGKNTGGMGAYSPSRLIDDKLEKKIIDKIIKPTIKGLSNIGCEYKGFLYTLV